MAERAANAPRVGHGRVRGKLRPGIHQAVADANPVQLDAGARNDRLLENPGGHRREVVACVRLPQQKEWHREELREAAVETLDEGVHVLSNFSLGHDGGPLRETHTRGLVHPRHVRRLCPAPGVALGAVRVAAGHAAGPVLRQESQGGRTTRATGEPDRQRVFSRRCRARMGQPEEVPGPAASREEARELLAVIPTDGVRANNLLLCRSVWSPGSRRLRPWSKGNLRHLPPSLQCCRQGLGRYRDFRQRQMRGGERQQRPAAKERHGPRLRRVP
mmetsp:Transcript_89733/g.267693  ORF Transcript_89733/g.267693 Transcript_89733/m.267693 type:complete len:274 (+) Transcript_89733:990-1811(+)